jgi:hypothetical protein
MQSAKAKWEAENELLKKQDACNLGMTHLAFNGTYEQWKNQENNKKYSQLQLMAANQQAQSSGMMGAYGMQGAYYNQLNRIFG